jgi:hypothetical protein
MVKEVVLVPEYSDQIIAYDFNNELKENYNLKDIVGKKLQIYPMVAPNSAKPPFLVYFWIPGHIESSSYILRQDSLRYVIYDSNADRLFKISNKIISMFDVGGGPRGPGVDTTVQSGVNVNNVTNRILSSSLIGSRSVQPSEKEGWYSVQLDFTVIYVAD